MMLYFEQIVILIFLMFFVYFLNLNYKRYSLTVFNFFSLGYFIFCLLGFLLSSFYSDRMAMLNYQLDRINLVFDDILVVGGVVVILSLFQKKRNKTFYDGITISSEKNISSASFWVCYFFLLIISAFFLYTVPILNSPLFNVGVYSFEEMSYYREVFYKNSNLLVIYFLLYIINPVVAFLIGRFKFNFLLLLPLVFTSTLTLSKTAIVFVLAFFIAGVYLRTLKVRHLLLGFAFILLSFTVIVYGTYMVTIERDFIDIAEVFIIRLVAVPISISAGYEYLYDFNDNYRTSVYYTYIFGGEYFRADLNACNYFVGKDCTMVTGLIGNSNLNVPYYLKYLYYVFICFFVFITSVFIQYMLHSKDNLIVVLLGFISFMFYLSEFTIVLNSYGYLWVLLLVMLYKLLPKKSFLYEK
ncbi:O-antigen polymerase [Rheinheimera sp. MMS21-TC3]|uniref:O-antigen polymerase n=1 Tax=Rheinheimera sp. MMS21-TC3 TaxID=3072790 RepID=UPI0028C4F044|nr:O-antigen polymerase [Rheinheimera sp. MMS21-TC3]WNO61698.1 O-antigen polymerase [Rheinheimera sp. MMS21-TC3]